MHRILATTVATLSILAALSVVSSSAAATEYTQGAACTINPVTLTTGETATITVSPGSVPPGTTISFSVTGSPAATLTPAVVAAGPDGGAHTIVTPPAGASIVTPPAGASGSYQIAAATAAGTVCTLTATVLPPDILHPATNTGLADTGINLGLIPGLAGGIILLGAAALIYTRTGQHKPGRHR